MTTRVKRNGWLAALGITLLGVAACADLRPIEVGVCGNLVVEGSEECDGPTTVGSCLPPGDALECRLSCRGNSGCPTGKVCGTDELCLDADICGNGVVEEGEDCDGDASEQLCHPATSTFACRFACTESNDCPDGYKCLDTGVCDSKNLCGNGIVEAGEDCDGQPEDSNLACRTSTDVSPCRFDCASTACPEGYFCDGDLCIRASGKFSLTNTIEGGSDGFLVADFDGDNREDVLQLTLTGVRIFFLDGKGGLKESNALNIGQTAPIVGDFNDDGRADIAFRAPSLYLNGGFELSIASVVNGRLQIVPQLGERLPGTATALEAVTPTNQDDLLFYYQGSVTGWSLQPSVSPSNNDVVLFGVSNELETGISSSLPLGTTRILRNSLCDRLGIAFRDSELVSIVTSCTASSTFNSTVPSTTLQMPSGYLPYATNTNDRPNRGGAIFEGDINGDGLSDVLIPVSGHGPLQLSGGSVGCKDDNDCSGTDDDCVCQDCLGKPECVNSCNLDQVCQPYTEPCSCSDCAAHPVCKGFSSVQVAYGRADNTYGDSPMLAGTPNQTAQLPAKLIPNYKCGKQEGIFGSQWLATALLNDDAHVDVVTSNGIYINDVSSGPGLFDLRYCPQQKWLEAEVGDFDGNGSRDVVAVRGNATVSLVRGDKNGAFSETTTDVPGVILRIAAGDFDGDTLDDVALLVAEKTSPSISDPVAIMVMYGQAFSSFGAPQLVGTLRGVTQLVAGRFTADNVADLLVSKPDGQAAILQGSVQRQMLSSLVFRTEAGLPYAVSENVTGVAAMVTGNFGTKGSDGFSNSLAVLTRESRSAGPLAPARLRAEVVGVNDEGRLIQRYNEVYACKQAGVCARRQLVAIDIDGDGVDTLMALTTNRVEFLDGELTPTPTAVEDVPGLAIYEAGRNAVQSALVARPWVEDVDLDGDEDVALLRNDGQIQVVFNNGKLDFAKSVNVQVEGAEEIRAFTFIPAGVGLPPYLLAATDMGVHRFRLATGSYVFDETLSGVSGGDSLVSVDVNGDTIPDLIVGQALRFRIYVAEEQAP